MCSSDLFDASALIKVYTDEDRSDVVREYFYNHSVGVQGRGSRVRSRIATYSKTQPSIAAQRAGDESIS